MYLELDDRITAALNLEMLRGQVGADFDTPRIKAMYSHHSRKYRDTTTKGDTAVNNCSKPPAVKYHRLTSNLLKHSCRKVTLRL